jgi:gamma-glutamyltranspeptidase/glutathione hydrolase
MPDEIQVEEHGISPDTIGLLERMGHKVKVLNEYWGDAESIAVDERTGELLGASDGRNHGKAVCY